MTTSDDRRRQTLPPHPFRFSRHCLECDRKATRRRRRAARAARKQAEYDRGMVRFYLGSLGVPDAFSEPLLGTLPSPAMKTLGAALAFLLTAPKATLEEARARALRGLGLSAENAREWL